MALINCPECGKQISDAAVSCPSCGFVISSINNDQNSSSFDIGEGTLSTENNETVERKKIPKFVVIVAVIIILVVVLAYMFRGYFASSIEMNIDGTTYLGIGKTYSLSTTVKPSFADTGSVSWKTSDPSIAVVEDGVIRGVGEGSCIITASTPNGKTDELTVISTDLIGSWDYEGIIYEGTSYGKNEAMGIVLKLNLTISGDQISLKSRDGDLNLEGTWEFKFEKNGMKTYYITLDDGREYVIGIKDDSMIIMLTDSYSVIYSR